MEKYGDKDHGAILPKSSMFDSHAHFFEPGRDEGLIWPPSSAPFHGRKLIAEYSNDFREPGESTIIAIEANPRVVDDLWLAQYAQQEASIAGYIANLQPDQPGFLPRLECHVAKPKFKGLRLRPIERFDLGSSLTHKICRALGAHGKILELGAKKSGRLPEIFCLAKSHPNLKVILDHAGHPDLNAPGHDEAWARHLSKRALPPNLWWKLTPNLGNSCTTSAKTELVLSSCLKHIATNVDQGKILLGSNWPVSSVESWREFQNVVMRCIPSLRDGRGASDAARKVYEIS